MDKNAYSNVLHLKKKINIKFGNKTNYFSNNLVITYIKK